MRQRETDANRARIAIDKADNELETVILPGLLKTDANESALIERVGAPDRDTLLLLAPGHTVWRERKTTRDAAITTFNDRMRLLDQTDLDDWSAERVHAERLQQERIAAQLQSVSQQIGAIVKGVADARAGNDIDQALRNETAAKDALRERFAARARQIVARRIADHVRRESELSSLSPVALIARQRFAAFTRGRYLLHFRSATGTPRFVAEDRDNSSREVELDHLSSATRLQLLIAVRAAFVEHQEKEALLPVFLDETLANSDDTRADAMVAASNDLSSHGRQLFYFTAQEDEVERWESWHHANPTVLFRAIPLGSGRRESPLRPAVTLSLVRKSVPPVPLNCTRFDYRMLLGGLTLDLWSDSPEDIHLW
ncbi:MAG: ATP-binding protein, partial [Thermomicrobiales bacterium]